MSLVMFKLFCYLFLIFFTLGQNNAAPKKSFPKKNNSKANDISVTNEVDEKTENNEATEIPSESLTKDLGKLILGETKQVKVSLDSKKKSFARGTSSTSKTAILDPSSSSSKSEVTSTLSLSSATERGAKISQRILSDHGYPRSERLKKIAAEYDIYLASRDSSKFKKMKNRKLNLCKLNGRSNQIAHKLCQSIRRYYLWELGTAEPAVCVKAVVNGNKKAEDVALCKLEWPKSDKKRGIVSSPLTGTILNTSMKGVQRPVAKAHDLTVAIFDGLDEFDYFVGKVEGGEMMKGKPDTAKVYDVTAVNLLTFKDEKLTERLVVDIAFLYAEMQKLERPISELATCFAMTKTEVKKMLLHALTYPYHNRNNQLDENEKNALWRRNVKRAKEIFFERIHGEMADLGMGKLGEEINLILSEFWTEVVKIDKSLSVIII